MSAARTTIKNPVFAGRMRQFSRGTPFVHVPALKAVVPVAASKAKPVRRVAPQSVSPAMPRQHKSEVLLRSINKSPIATKKSVRQTKSKGKMLAVGMLSTVSVASLVAVLLVVIRSS